MGKTNVRTLLLVGEFRPPSKSLPRQLAQRGFIVIHATSADEALAMFAEGNLPIDMVVIDAITPSAAVLDLTAEIARSRPGFPVLYVVGAKRTIVRSSIETQSPSSVLVAPFAGDDLMARIARLAATQALPGAQFSPAA